MQLTSELLSAWWRNSNIDASVDIHRDIYTDKSVPCGLPSVVREISMETISQTNDTYGVSADRAAPTRALRRDIASDQLK